MIIKAILTILSLLLLLFKSLVDFLMLRLGLRRPRSALFLQENFAPVFDELSNVALLPEDSHSVPLPKDFPEGTYVRNGPNPQFVPTRGDHHWFDGDSMLHAVTIDHKGNMRYRNRFTQTEKYVAEKKHQQPIVYGIMQYANPFIHLDYLYQKIFRGLKSVPSGGTSNTSVTYHAGKLLALMEVVKPYEVKVPSLTTVGQYDFDGKLKNGFTAHPKIDPVTGEMIAFGYYIREAKLAYSVTNKDGEMVHSTVFDKSPFATMMHDFACTQDYSIFMFFPLIFTPRQVLNGLSPWKFSETTKTKIAVIPRYYQPEKDEIQWFEAETGYAFHTVNAYQEGDTIVIRSCRAAAAQLDFDIADLSEAYPNPAKVYEWRLNLKTKQVTEGPLRFRDESDPDSEPIEIIGDFPVVNPNYETRKNRYAWVAGVESNFILSKCLYKLDFEKLTYRAYNFGPQKAGGEWVVVPKKNSQSEDDVYAMTFLYNREIQTSTFEVIDGKSLDETNMTITTLPRRVPYGFHGKFVPSM